MSNVTKFSGELMTMVNKYIDQHNLTTEEVCGTLDVVSFRVKEASRPEDAILDNNESAIESNLQLNEGKNDEQ